MAQRFEPTLFDKLFGAADVSERGWTLEQLKESVARDLEALLNTRTALTEESLEGYPHAAASVLTYGMRDFADLCLTSDEDQKKVCAAVKLAVERHEPRLVNVTAAVRVQRRPVLRVQIQIEGTLRAAQESGAVRFSAMLKPWSQQYLVKHTPATEDLPAEEGPA